MKWWPVKSQVEWILFHRVDGCEPVEFFEVRLHRETVWSCRGAPLTFGTSEVREFESSKQALREFERLMSLKQSEGWIVAARGKYTPGQFDFVELKDAVKTASRLSFASVVATYGDQAICSFGLVTDDVPMTIYAMAQSVEGIEAEADEDYRSEARWNLQAWSLEAGSNHFDVPYRMLLRQSRGDIPFERNLDDDTFAQNAFEAFVSALEELRDEGEFSKVQHLPFLLLVEVSDSAPIEGMAERLNVDQDILNRYRAFAG